MSEGKRLRLTGRCYHNGRQFVAQLSQRDGDREQYFTLALDPHLTALLEEAFNFLLSGDEERVIAGYAVKKALNPRNLPYIVISVAGAKYGLVAAARQPNAAKLILSLPFVGGAVVESMPANSWSESYDPDAYDVAQAGGEG